MGEFQHPAHTWFLWPLQHARSLKGLLDQGKQQLEGKSNEAVQVWKAAQGGGACQANQLLCCALSSRTPAAGGQIE